METVAHRIHSHGQLGRPRELVAERARGRLAFCERLVLTMYAEQAAEAPMVARVRLHDIDADEVGDVAEALNDAASLVSRQVERRSAVAASGDDERPARPREAQVSKLAVAVVVKPHDRRVRRRLADPPRQVLHDVVLQVHDRVSDLSVVRERRVDAPVRLQTLVGRGIASLAQHPPLHIELDGLGGRHAARVVPVVPRLRLVGHAQCLLAT
mmetsp:Transcript_1208/g.3868  ORF Transcript_1208/g.3868 Transcript_1208/m.3868 type:complete len:212 (+) Transcript_1208:251-886(+)